MTRHAPTAIILTAAMMALVAYAAIATEQWGVAIGAGLYVLVVVGRIVTRIGRDVRGAAEYGKRPPPGKYGRLTRGDLDRIRCEAQAEKLAASVDAVERRRLSIFAAFVDGMGDDQTESDRRGA